MSEDAHQAIGHLDHLFQMLGDFRIMIVRLTTKVFEDDKVYLLEMTPSSKALREFFQTILLTIEKNDYTVRSIEMNEPAGDKTIISFMNKKSSNSMSWKCP